jgi:hypothetical protein
MLKLISFVVVWLLVQEQGTNVQGIKRAEVDLQRDTGPTAFQEFRNDFSQDILNERRKRSGSQQIGPDEHQQPLPKMPSNVWVQRPARPVHAKSNKGKAKLEPTKLLLLNTAVPLLSEPKKLPEPAPLPEKRKLPEPAPFPEPGKLSEPLKLPELKRLLPNKRLNDVPLRSPSNITCVKCDPIFEHPLNVKKTYDYYQFKF